MNHDEFVGQVQHRAHLASRGDAELIIRATFETLGERLQSESAQHVAAQLPPELGRHLRDRKFEHLSVHDFCARVAEREHADVAKATFHARCVYDTLRDAISPGAVGKIERQLPEEFTRLLRPAEA
ncbi:MAG TPA: DUF2267 domain-containing protein [Thermoanaerobaculia bacterium]